jgi:hypothetical protein
MKVSFVIFISFLFTVAVSGEGLRAMQDKEKKGEDRDPRDDPGDKNKWPAQTQCELILTKDACVAKPRCAWCYNPANLDDGRCYKRGPMDGKIEGLPA